MASAYKHGVYVNEVATSLIAPVEGTAGLQVVIGTAPVNLVADPEAAVNKPILAYTYKEAVQALGYSSDFEHYTLCEAINASFNVVGTAPLVLINVLDPKEHTTQLAEKTINVTEGVATITDVGVILKDLKVNDGSEVETEYKIDEDFTAEFNDDGTLDLVILDTGKAGKATSLKVSGKLLNPSAIKPQDIVGSVDPLTGAETGIQVVRQVYPKLGMTPGIITAPRFSKSPEVSAALQTATKEVSGMFRSVCIVDLDSSETGAKVYTDVNTKKTAQALTDGNCYAVWLYGKVGDTVYSGSTLASALTAYTDAANDDTPNVSPSNKVINISASCREDGTEVLLDRDQANTVNSFGVATWLNFNGYRLWGNNTVAYPGTTDPKDRWFSVRRFLNWAGNTFILTYSQRVDSPMNKQLIEAIVDSENVRGNSFVSRGICARYQIVYLEEENPTTELLNGHITFHQYMTPFPPAEHIEDIIEFDPEALSTALAG